MNTPKKIEEIEEIIDSIPVSKKFYNNIDAYDSDIDRCCESDIPYYARFSHSDSLGVILEFKSVNDLDLYESYIELRETTLNYRNPNSGPRRSSRIQSLLRHIKLLEMGI
jgi:hypothetical protein